MAKAGSDHRGHSGPLAWIERVEVAGFSPLARLAGTLAIFGAAWGARALVDPLLPPGFPYVTFFPAVILTTFLFGLRAGLVSGVLCGLVAWYYYISPNRSFSLAGAEVALGLYVFVVATDLALIHGMRVANRRLREERVANQRQAEELRGALEALRESEVKTHLATRTAGIGIWQWHVPSGKVYGDDTMLALYGIAEREDETPGIAEYNARVHPEDLARQQQILAETVRNRSESTREFRILRGDDGRVRHLRAVEVARAGADGITEWVVGTNLDITEEKDRESHIRLLLGEVNHRAKNLLAVVLSVARRTSGADHETFLQNFAARIQSLATGQDLLVRNAWRGVGLRALVTAQRGHYKDLLGTRILLEGEDIALGPHAVQTLGMALHELATNAGKHGALSQDGGEVLLRWECSGPGAAARVTIVWQERGGPPISPPAASGFGSVVIGDMVRNSLDAGVEIRFEPAGFVWRMDCALAAIIEQDEPGAPLR
ncbi:HWE histidine kinase domain-containing protein [Porphyrobacter sp. AAP82]|uniref:HWE histidine kinase domain-containing protein n=1 Tax=Porphyrobacter sp. AAP82 TaxID=1248917 RepID=UPI000305BA56|nr:HWE histidine kinase domain-containing protein [Porphyrobacter sp. AAP82]